MRLIHTSDWHFGQTLRGNSRNAEQEYFITQLITYIKEYKPDALLVSGDLYDSSTSTAETDNFFRIQILRIHQAAPDMHIIMIAGNHDGYAKQEADAKLWELGNITVVGHIATRDGQVDYDRHIINLENKGFILPVPFTRFYPTMPQDDALNLRKSYFYDRLLKRVATLNTGNLPVIMMGHLNYEGAEIAEQESLVRGGEDPTTAKELGTGYDYLALGHIHYPQTHNRARYSGSPIAINFSEGYEHSVTLVEINRHGEMPQLTELPVKQLFGMKKFVQQPELTLTEFLKDIENHIGNTPNYLRLALIQDEEPFTTKEQIINSFVEQNDKWIYCGYDTIQSATATKSESTVLTPQQLENNDPIDLAKQYYKEKNGSDMSEALQQLLQQAIDNYQQIQETTEQ